MYFWLGEKHFLGNWQRITIDSKNLGYVGDYKILLLETPCQTERLPPVKMKDEQRLIEQKKVE